MGDLLDEITKGVSELLYDDDPKGIERAHPYSNLEKAKVLQDARIFHDDHLVRTTLDIENDSEASISIGR